MHLLALVRSVGARRRLARSAAGWARVTLIDSATTAESALRVHCVDALILELDSADDVGANEAFVRRVRESFPKLPVVLYAPLTRDTARRIMHLANAGADELLLADQDDGGDGLESLVIRAHVSRCAARAIDAMGDQLPAAARAILVQCMHLARKPLSVAARARAVGVNRKTLVNRLGAAGLPGPETVISWCRLLIACELLEDRGRSVERVALLLGFGSGAALRNMFRRYLGARSERAPRVSGPRDSGSSVVREPWASPTVFPSGYAACSSSDCKLARQSTFCWSRSAPYPLPCRIPDEQAETRRKAVISMRLVWRVRLMSIRDPHMRCAS